MTQFVGKVVLITGAGRGIGRSCALHLARLGADIIVNDIDLHSAAKIGEKIFVDTPVDEVRALGVRALAAEADVTDEAAVGAMVETAMTEFGRIDILINNAGGTHGGGAVSELSYDAWNKDIAYNLNSAFLCSRAVIPHMREQRRGKILNISSVSGFRPMNARLAAYSVGKAAMHALTRTLALELAPDNINVNAVALGDVDNALFRRNVGAVAEAMRRQVPLNRFASLAECDRIVEFMVSEAANYMTGQVVVFDGGLIHLNPSFGGGSFEV